MITALDTSVLLDVATNDRSHCGRSAQALKVARNTSQLIVSEFVVAELTPICGQETHAFLQSLDIKFVASTYLSSLDAGLMFADYLSRGGKRGRIVADFLIGAHALEQSNRLLTRDTGFFRDYFSKLEIWYP